MGRAFYQGFKPRGFLFWPSLVHRDIPTPLKSGIGGGGISNSGNPFLATHFPFWKDHWTWGLFPHPPPPPPPVRASRRLELAPAQGFGPWPSSPATWWTSWPSCPGGATCCASSDLYSSPELMSSPFYFVFLLFWGAPCFSTNQAKIIPQK